MFPLPHLSRRELGAAGCRGGVTAVEGMGGHSPLERPCPPRRLCPRKRLHLPTVSMQEALFITGDVTSTEAEFTWRLSTQEAMCTSEAVPTKYAAAFLETIHRGVNVYPGDPMSFQGTPNSSLETTSTQENCVFSQDCVYQEGCVPQGAMLMKSATE